MSQLGGCGEGELLGMSLGKSLKAQLLWKEY